MLQCSNACKHRTQSSIPRPSSLLKPPRRHHQAPPIAYAKCARNLSLRVAPSTSSHLIPHPDKPQLHLSDTWPAHGPPASRPQSSSAHVAHNKTSGGQPEALRKVGHRSPGDSTRAMSRCLRSASPLRIARTPAAEPQRVPTRERVLLRLLEAWSRGLAMRKFCAHMSLSPGERSPGKSNGKMADPARAEVQSVCLFHSLRACGLTGSMSSVHTALDDRRFYVLYPVPDSGSNFEPQRGRRPVIISASGKDGKVRCNIANRVRPEHVPCTFLLQGLIRKCHASPTHSALERWTNLAAHPRRYTSAVIGRGTRL